MTKGMTSRKVEATAGGNRSWRSGAFVALVTLLGGFHSGAQATPLASVSPATAASITIAWAAGAFGNQTADRPVENVRFPPDGKCTTVSRSSWLLAVTFNRQVTYPTNSNDPNLVAELGVTADELKSYDIIAFEGNSNDVQFENSIWFVTDNVTWAGGTFLGRPKATKPVKPAKPEAPVLPQHLRFYGGSMPFTVYSKIFHVKEMKDAHGNQVDNVGWILVDIPDTVKMDPAAIKVFLTGLHGTGVSKFDGSPDPDAIGLIVH